MTCGIYMILNKNNGKIYIGQSIDAEYRMKKHKQQLTGNYHLNTHLQRAWNKYGEDAFEFNLLEKCPKESLNNSEKWWIEYCDSTNQDKGYNHQSGGSSNFTVSDTARKHMSDAHKGIVSYHPTDEQKRELSIARKGKGNPMYGKHHTMEHKLKLSKSRNNTGYFRVSKRKDSGSAQGFTYQYRWTENGTRNRIFATDIEILKEKVLERGLEWIKLDEEYFEIAKSRINDGQERLV